MAQTPSKPKNLKQHEGMAWDILSSEGKEFNEWKRHIIAEESLLFLQGNNKELENLIIEKKCNALIAEKLPTLLRQATSRQN